MADNFSANHVQGVFGQFKPVFDDAVDQSANNVQGIFGEFDSVLDEAAGAGVGADVFVAAISTPHPHQTRIQPSIMIPF